MKKNNYSNKNNTALAKEWIKLADENLKFAKSSFDEFYSHICVQSHQATEKYLKGFLVFHKKTFPKIHDLSYFVKECAKINCKN